MNAKKFAFICVHSRTGHHTAQAMRPPPPPKA